MKSFELVNCDLCGSNKSSTLLENVITWEHPGKFKVVKCSECGLVYLSPRPKLKQISKYYPNEEYWGWDTDYDQESLRKQLYEPIYSIIFNNKNNGSILDIGTGS